MSEWLSQVLGREGERVVESSFCGWLASRKGLPHATSLSVFCRFGASIIFERVKKKKSPKKLVRDRTGTRFLRRLVRKMLSSWLKRQTFACREDVEALFAKLREVEESIEIIARQIARQVKSIRR